MLHVLVLLFRVTFAQAENITGHPAGDIRSDDRARTSRMVTAIEDKDAVSTNDTSVVLQSNFARKHKLLRDLIDFTDVLQTALPIDSGLPEGH
ncbi:hypothetical protein B0H10DRAFT_2224937 [Mycena sp. CBHHK59/15]|nr:hypothetical protein B0H10DRAFT_2224937 [Mycena sp. CBHHK59/15]